MDNISLIDVNRITLDLSVHRIVNVRCKKNDTNTRKLFITLTNDGEFYPVDSTVEVTYKICKGDGTYVYNSADSILEDGTIYIDLTPQCVAFSGLSQSELQLMKDGKIISTMPFNIIVDKSKADEGIVSSNEFKVLLDYMEKSKRYDTLTNEVFVKIGKEIPRYLRSGDFYLKEY